MSIIAREFYDMLIKINVNFLKILVYLLKYTYDNKKHDIIKKIL